MTSFEHLFEGSPIIIGTKGAWLVQEPQVLHTGQVGIMVFGPGRNEVVIAARERVHVTERDLSDPAASLKLQAVGETVSIVNLTTGSKRPVALPRNDLRFGYLNWASSRIIYASASGPEWSGAVLIDTLTGRSHPYTSNDHWPISSGVPHLAVFRSAGKREEGTSSPGSLELIDLSTSPPGYQKISLPPQAANPIHFTRNQTLICQAGKDGLIEVNLSNGSSQAWNGDPASLTLGKGGQERTSEDPRPELEAVIHGGEQGGLWIMESEALTPQARGSAGAASQPKLPATYRPSMRLSKDADFADINPTGSRVLFRAMGAAFCAELTKIDLAKAMELLAAHARVKAMNYGKQAATAAMIYAADYDDFMPVSGGQAKDTLAPYIKDASLLDRIVWTNLQGQNVGKIEKPAEFQLGYVPGPGGKAVIFADGHVQWIPD